MPTNMQPLDFSAPAPPAIPQRTLPSSLGTGAPGEHAFSRVLESVQRMVLERDRLVHARETFNRENAADYQRAAELLHDFDAAWRTGFTDLVNMASLVFPGNGWEANNQLLSELHLSHLQWMTEQSDAWSKLLPDLRRAAGSDAEKRVVLALLFNIVRSLPGSAHTPWIGTIKG